MRNVRPGSAKFFSKKKMFHEISVIPARWPSISSIDRSVAEQPGIFSKLWVLGAKAAQRVCEYFHVLSRSRRVHDFWINYTHVCAKENTKNSFWSVSASNSLIHAPECEKCILRDPNFQNFPGEHTPLEARALCRSLQTPSASFSISPPTSQILPSTPFLIENPELSNMWSVRCTI